MYQRRTYRFTLIKKKTNNFFSALTKYTERVRTRMYVWVRNRPKKQNNRKYARKFIYSNAELQRNGYNTSIKAKWDENGDTRTWRSHSRVTHGGESLFLINCKNRDHGQHY